MSWELGLRIVQGEGLLGLPVPTTHLLVHAPLTYLHYIYILLSYLSAFLPPSG